MENLKEKLKLYAIIGTSLLKNEVPIEVAVENAILGGATMIQLREKRKGKSTIINIANTIKPICNKYEVPLIINDSIEIASIVGADGVHLGLKDGDLLYARRILGKEAIIGATAHNLMEAQMAWAAGADYLGCGAMFGSKTKRRTVALTIEKLTEICEKLPIPVVAIGGINCENMMQLKGIGIAGAAVVSAIFDQEDIRTATAALDTVMTKMMQQ